MSDTAGIARQAFANTQVRSKEAQCQTCGLSDYRNDQFVRKYGNCPDCYKRNRTQSRDLAAATSSRIRNTAFIARNMIHAEIEDVQTAVWEPARKRSAEKATRLLARRYLPAINAIRDATDRDQLERLQSTLLDRLEQGWTMESTDKRNNLFERLLIELELTMDCLAEDCTWRYLDRLRDLEAAWHS